MMDAAIAMAGYEYGYGKTLSALIHHAHDDRSIMMSVLRFRIPMGS
jgi:hypothetical protein